MTGTRWREADGTTCVVLSVVGKTVRLRDETGAWAGEEFEASLRQFQALWTPLPARPMMQLELRMIE